MRALLCLGKLIKLEFADGRKASVKNRWLAWDGRNLHICTVKGTTKQKLPAAVVAKHRTFHDADPKGQPFIGDCPTPVGRLTQVGLVKALVYTVPRKITSPEKNPYQWHHAFGDTGHEGGNYPEKVMPALVKDQKGNLFFKRRPGNIYRVDQWIRG
jgi:hypothetical protein